MAVELQKKVKNHTICQSNRREIYKDSECRSQTIEIPILSIRQEWKLLFGAQDVKTSNIRSKSRCLQVRPGRGIN